MTAECLCQEAWAPTLIAQGRFSSPGLRRPMFLGLAPPNHMHTHRHDLLHFLPSLLGRRERMRRSKSFCVVGNHLLFFRKKGAGQYRLWRIRSHASKYTCPTRPSLMAPSHWPLPPAKALCFSWPGVAVSISCGAWLFWPSQLPSIKTQPV